MNPPRLPELIVVSHGFLWVRPKIWLMMPNSNTLHESFQVGEFRDHASAELAGERLVEEMRRLRAEKNT